MRTRPADRAVKIGGADIREDGRRVNGARGLFGPAYFPLASRPADRPGHTSHGSQFAYPSRSLKVAPKARRVAAGPGPVRE